MELRKAAWSLIFLALLLGTSGSARAHCDGLDGPVVGAAREALRTGDVNRVLIWVKPGGEAEIRAAFQKTLAVRKLSTQARDLADMYFFETLVRVHRPGEGAPYTGLRPAGRDLGPAIPAADRALAQGDVDALVKLVSRETEHGIRERFESARAARTYRPSDLASGREYVVHYVTFIHYVEGIHQAASGSVSGHFEEAEAQPHHHSE